MPNEAVGLRTYREKRNFRRTPEPATGARARRSSGDSFVVQKHDASRLHYDFRLELDGVLLSWAVPKGPPTVPGVKVLAVRTEDHPLAYASFEGVIPKGQYGGGTVMVWDRGHWRADGDARAGLAAGKLDIELAGERLRGRWSLVRMRKKANERAENWLLIKRHDAADATPSGAPRAPRESRASGDDDRSVQTGRSLAEIADGVDRRQRRRGRARARERAPEPALPGARKAPMPASLAPQLATLVDAPPAGDDWLHEVKFDGYRLLAFVDRGKVRWKTRTGQDWSGRFARLSAPMLALGVRSAVIDGEVVVLRPDGTSDFQRLQNQLDRGDDARLVYFAFDLVHLDGEDLGAVPLLQRKQRLERLLAAAPDTALRFSEHVVGHGPTFYARACALGLEGVVSKRADSSYSSRRTRTWVKAKCLRRQELVVGGWTSPAGSRAHFGALLLGVYDGGELRYAGKVGTGFSDESLAEMMRVLRPLATKVMPFADGPGGVAARRAHWVRPECVVEVAFTEWTGDGRLRHPSFQGRREDKDPRSIRRERPAHSDADAAAAAGAAVAVDAPASRAATKTAHEPVVAGVHLSHADRVLYEDPGLTKLDVARYYEAVAEHLLPHVAGRPLTIVRCPQGLAGACFYQKQTAALPQPVRSYSVSDKNGDVEQYVGVDDLPGLVTLVQFGVLELHPWPCRGDQLERPDRIVIDLDPGPGVPWARVVAAARQLRDMLAALGLVSFARTTGGKGLHVVLPIARQSEWDDVKAFSRELVAVLARTDAAGFVLTASKAQRRGRIFLDYLRNSRGATAIASYSTRARPGAPVAMPLAWRDVTDRLDPMAFTVLTVPRLLAKRGDAWRDFASTRQAVTAAMRAALRRL